MPEKDLLGRTEEEALEILSKVSTNYRVYKRDGRLVFLPGVFSDESRINLNIENGIVVRVFRG